MIPPNKSIKIFVLVLFLSEIVWKYSYIYITLHRLLILYRIETSKNIIMERKRNNLRIAAIMQEKGLTLTDLANKIVRTDKDNNQRTITKATMSSRINGNPSLSNLYEIADALGVKITELFPEEDQWQECDKTQKAPSEFKIQTVCPSCGAKISASIKAE